VYENKQKAKRPSELAAAEIQKALINKFLTKQTASTEKGNPKPRAEPKSPKKRYGGKRVGQVKIS